jgi:glycosyltransferase involved in cell wall biosynthesis
MNIVVVNHYAGGASLGMEFRPYYLAKALQRKGHQVMIIGGSFSHLRIKQPVMGAGFKMETIDEIKYVWIKVNEYSGNGPRRIVSMIRFVIGLYIQGKNILKNFKPDLIIASSTYPMDNFAVKKLARSAGAKFCYEVHDLWPLSPKELGGYSKYHPFIMMVQWAEDFAYRHADFVVSMLPDAKNYMISRGLDPKKFFHIPNGIWVDEWQNPIELPNEHRDLISEIRKKHTFLVGYAGGHSISNALDSLVMAGDLLPDDCAILLIGDGIDKPRLQEISRKQNKRNIYFLPPVPKRCIPILLSNFNTLFIGAQRQSLYRFGISPNKLIDYMMAGKPIIQSIEASNNMVEDYQCGIAVEPENAKAVAEGISKIMKMKKSEQEKLGKNGHEAALKFHDYNVLSEQFINAANLS